MCMIKLIIVLTNSNKWRVLIKIAKIFVNLSLSKKIVMVNNPVIRVYRSYIQFIYLNMSDNFRILVLLKTCNVFQYFMTHIINESY